MIDKIQNYRDYEAISYSLLSKLTSNPKQVLAEDKEESQALNFGSLVDCLMFTPEDFEERFYTISTSKPSGEMLKWLNAYLEMSIPADFTLQDTDKLILQARQFCGYNKALKDETALQKFHEACDSYLNALALAGDRVIVTNEDVTRAVSYQSRLLSNEFTADFFSLNHQTSFHEVKFQHDIYFKIEGIQCKALLDGVIFNHDKKIIQPFDLKTTSESIYAFEGEFIKWRYYLQAGLYRKGLSIVYPDYKILPFKFIIINDWDDPFVWGVDEQLHSICLLGGMLRNGRKIKGVYQLIEEYKWHESENKWSYPATYYTNDGVKWIDIH